MCPEPESCTKQGNISKIFFAPPFFCKNGKGEHRFVLPSGSISPVKNFHNVGKRPVPAMADDLRAA